MNMEHTPSPSTPTETPWQELTTRLQDPLQGPAERQRLLTRLHTLQAQLRAQAEQGLPATAYASLGAARQAVDAALQILDRLPTAGANAHASSGPAHSPVFSKGEPQ